MQTVSALYTQIMEGLHYFETKLEIEGVGTILPNQIFSITTNAKMFERNPEIGKAVSSEIDCKVEKPNTKIPRMAKVEVFTRVCNATQHSEWLPQGVFYVDTREENVDRSGLKAVKFHGFDAMLKAEQPFQSDQITGDSTDVQMVAEIARIIGVEVDGRTFDVMGNRYTIPLPTGYSCREVLGYIASMYVGSFVITDDGKLRLVSLLEIPPETNLLVTEDGDVILFGDTAILVERGEET